MRAADRRRRHGEHEPRTVSLDRRSRGLEIRPAEGARFHAARRVVVRLRGCGDGSRGRLHRRQPRCQPSRSRRIRRGKPSPRVLRQSNRVLSTTRSCPSWCPSRKGERRVARDEGPRPDSSLEILAKLRPAFDGDGTVTAGNSSQLSDGAAAVSSPTSGPPARARSPLMARIVASGNVRRSAQGTLHRAGHRDRAGARQSKAQAGRYRS